MGMQKLSKHVLGKLELGDQPYQAIETASALISTWVWVKYKQWEAAVAAGRRKADRQTPGRAVLWQSDMTDEVNTYELLELNSQEERSQKIQGLLESCRNPTELHPGVAIQAEGSVQAVATHSLRCP